MRPSSTPPLLASDALQHFRPDSPHEHVRRPRRDLVEGQIDGCTAVELVENSDDRGDLLELMSVREGDQDPMVHAYQVFCAPGSIRAWIYHAEQTDRICCTDGSFRVVLCDLRAGSATEGNIVTLFPGSSAPMLISIPPFVAHGVQNVGSGRASFVNFPTRVYRHERPDKFRLPFDSPVIPFSW